MTSILGRISFIAACCFISLQSWAADLYVSTTGNDSNSGGINSPFKTIQKAADMAAPGTTVHVAPGTYIEGVVSKVNGTASARIRFVSDTKWGAKIVPPASADSIWKSTGGYTEIDGFEFDGTGNKVNRQGIYFTGGNSRALNNHVHHIAQSSGCDNGGGAAIVADQYRGTSFGNYDFIGNVVHHVGAADCNFIQGIYHASTGTIKNNLVYAVGAYGIHLWHDDHNIDIVNNTVFGCGNGIVYGGADQNNYFGPADFIRIYNNIIFDNTGTGIAENSIYGSNNVIRNNLVFKNGVNYNVSGVTGDTRVGEITADPQFVNYVRGGGGDYHLKSTSPAINAGTASLALATDLEGTVRPQGAGIDIGAYEYKALAPAPTATPVSILPTPTPVPSSGGQPILSLSSKSLTFSSQLVGTQSAVQIVTITNTGNAPLIFSEAFAMSGDFVFGGTGTCEDLISYIPGSSCTASVVFKPAAIGTRTGTLSLPSNASPSPATVALSGNGTSATTPLTSITSPGSGTSVAVRSNISILAQASDDNGVSSVEFYVNGNLKCKTTVAPYKCVWKVPRGRGVVYSLQTKATDKAGNIGLSSKVTVTSK